MKKLLVFLMLFVLHKQLPAQNYKFQALFIYNISQRIEWPDVNNAFVIGVVGTKELQNELQAIAQKRQLFGHPIEVREVSPSKLDVEGCHLVYLARTMSSKVDQVKSLIASKPVLLIGEKPGIEGVGINFIDNSKKIEFEIYPQTIKAHKLNVTSSLMSLGIVKN